MTTETDVPNIYELGKVPDFVKDLREFDGRHTELMNWIADVEEILTLCVSCKISQLLGTLVQRTIRRKIVGEAAEVLNTNNISTDWKEIKEVLLLHYGDKRDLFTLDFELSTMRKSNGESLTAYYGRVKETLALIIAHVQTNEKYREHAPIHTQFFNEKALHSFIRGLDKPLSFILKTSAPANLSKAYQLCQEYYSTDLRFARMFEPRGQADFNQKPVPKPRGSFNPMPYPRASTSFVPSTASHSVPNTTHTIKSNRYQTPTPMEVDGSIRYDNGSHSRRFTQQTYPRVPSTQVKDFKRQANTVHDDMDRKINNTGLESDYQHQQSEYEAGHDHNLDGSLYQNHFLEWDPKW